MIEVVNAVDQRHQLPQLPYPHAALEPYIDARTMQLHHGEHHARYVEELNGALGDAIARDFGSFNQFKARFDEAGVALRGCGWVWLARALEKGGGLEVLTTPAHDHPLMHDRFPLLVNDLWEHAYYLKHENRRSEYLNGWWPVVNWPEAARRYERSEHSTDEKSPRFPWTKQTF